MLAIFVASAQSDPDMPDQVSDKTLHALAYGTLGVTATRAVAGGFPMPVGPTTAVVAWLLTTGYGVSDEFHQSFTPGRSPDPADVVADAVGATVAVVFCWACGIIAARFP